ncbi:MAG: response regulator transcription factor [Saprospiraceae bacterium]|jgi:two-component system alkaline phosphatase synthesis response regulator PhoP|nr:response regulator transcription factor [Saprospiraceae bacterium]MBP6238845.1 response regulator transcription factor [Saprospiraceae bacterium]MBP6567711.1 response regulator transcription factor [Saprospiraceae bacterium]MBP9197871.1 response regulator transcription factor [Saprospiraceae bacterium]
MSAKQKILVVDDEEDILEILKYNLEKEGFEVKTASDGNAGIEMAEKFDPHLIILDIMMPGMDGIEVCQKLRANPKFSNTIIAFLTARSEAFTQITALDSGGDDFINKPIKPNVLKSRINALLRRQSNVSEQEKSQITKFGDLEIDFEQFKVSVNNVDKGLAKKEFELISLLASKPGKVFKRNEILAKIWGNDVIVGDRTIDVHIRKLREKIGDSYIQTMKGVGYKFDF